MIYFLDGNQEVIKIVRSSAVISAIQTQELPEDNSLLRDYLSVRLKNDERLFNAQYMAIKTHGANRNAFDLYRIASELVPDNATEFTGIQVAPYELEGVVIEDLRPQNRPLNQTMNQVLEDSDWRIGYVADNLPNVTTNFYYMSVKDALKKIQELTNVEMLFKVEISGNKITDKWVEVYHQLGNRTMKRFNYGTNALSVVRESSHDELYTALIGRGKGEEVGETESGDATYGRKINFADIEWKKSAGKPVDKPKGQKYIELSNATAEYGIKLIDGRKVPRIGIVDFSETDDPEKLIQQTYQELLVRARPKVLFKASVINTGDMLIGDTVTIHRHDLDFHYQARVRKVVRDRKNNNKTQVEIGDVVHTPSTKRQGQINSALNNVASDLENVRGEVTEARQSADGKNTNFYGNVEPHRKKVGDTWFRDHPSLTGESQILVWNGEAWELTIDTSETTKNADAIAGQQQEIADTKENIDNRLEDLDIELTGKFTDINDEILTIEEISNQAQINASTAIDNAFEALQQASQAIDNTGSLNVRVDEVENTLSLTADKQTVADLTGVVDSQALDIQANAQGLALKANQDTVDTLAGTVQSLGTEFDIVAGQVSSRVWNTDIETAIDDIEVGGRNLIRNSDFSDSNSFNGWTSSYGKHEITDEGYLKEYTSSAGSMRIEKRFYLEETGTFTFSIFAKTTEKLEWSNHEGLIASKKEEVVIDDEFKVYHFTFKNEEAGQKRIRGYQRVVPVGTQILIKWEKLEKGNKATDWTPAPEDTDAKIDYIETEFTQKYDSISSTVTNLDGQLTSQTQEIGRIIQTIQDVTENAEGNTTKINQTIDTVDSHSQTIATIETDLDGKVEVSEYNTLVNTVDSTIRRIGDAEGNITQIEASINGLQTTVAGKADRTEVTQLATGYNVLVDKVALMDPSNKNLIVEEDLTNQTIDYNGNSSVTNSRRLTPFIEIKEGLKNLTLATSNATGSHWYGAKVHWYRRIGTYDAYLGTYNVQTFFDPGDWYDTISIPSVNPMPTHFRMEGAPISMRSEYKLEIGPEHTGFPPLNEYDDTEIYSQLSVLNNNINLRVKKGDVVGQINIEAGTTLIENDKLYLDAETVAFSGKAFIPSAAITELTADKINTGTLNAANVSIINLNAHNIVTGTLTGIRVEADSGLIGGWNLESGGLYKETPYGYTTLKPGGNVAIGIASPNYGYTTGAALQIWHDGTIRFGELGTRIYSTIQDNLRIMSHNRIVLTANATVETDSRIIPQTNGNLNLGELTNRWSSVYSNSFRTANGSFQPTTQNGSNPNSSEIHTKVNLELVPEGQVYSRANIMPWSSNYHYLGSSGYRWQGVYLTSQPNVSSDMRDKKLIQDIPKGLLDHLIEIKPKMYQQDDKWHFGYIAQDVERAIYKYATNKQTWATTKELKDFTSSFAMLHKDESKLSLLYGEIAVIKEAEMQARMDRLENKLEELIA